MLTISLLQTRARMSSTASPIMPPAVSASASAVTRGVIWPFGSPSSRRLPVLATLITPGSTTVQADDTTPPMARCGPTAFHTASPGSMRGRRRPSNRPASAWKYHQGMPFMAKATAVSGPSNGPMPAASDGSDGAFSVTSTASCGPSAAGSSVAVTLAWNSASGAITRRPLAWIAANWGPRATTDTSAPPRASRAAKWPPTAPAP